jgi:hypothetical protein
MKKIVSIIVLMICLGVSGQSNAQCADKPTINDFSPKTGFIGSTVTITGANFNATPGNNQVFFGATQATVVSSSFGTLEVRVPEGSTTSLISVKNHCNLTAYSKTHFNGIFCPTPLTNTSYQNVSQELTGVYGAYNMLSQDMDNDGKPEVISARNGGGITIAINNSTPGNINFTRYNQGSTGGAAQSIAVADFDGDGLKDIVTNSAIMRNTSTGVGNIGLVYVTNSRGVSNYQVGAGDFNNDGKIDIIGNNGNGIYIAFNTSTGPGNFNFTNRIYITNVGVRCTGIQIADVDGDGKTDFLGSQGSTNRAVSIRNTTANGSFTPSFEAPEYWNSGGAYPYRSMIADFDKDGKIDFTSCNFYGATNVAIWRNTSIVGNISFAPTVNFSSPTRNYRIGVGDVDGDGYPDVVTKSLGVNVFSVYRNTSSAPGAISFAPRIDYSSSRQAEVSGIVIGDLDGDFVPDIATSGISSNTIRFHRNTGAQNDVTPPTAVCRNITVALSPNGTVSITPEMIDNGSGDACGIESLTLSLSDFTCADIGPNTVTLTATDGAGNSASCTATVNVQPAAIIVAGQSTVCQGETVPMNANDGDTFQWKKDGTNIAGATNQNYIATTTGAYTVVVTNAGGCSGESLVTPVVVNENPTVDISPSGNAFLCPPSGTATLTATQSSIYQWMKDGVDIPNATQQTYEATTVGSYSVSVIDLFGCSAVSDVTTISANPAEIDVTGDGNYGNVFPNQNYTRTITISNTGSGSLDISNLMVTGADASSFTLSGFSAPGSISPGSSATVDITFNAPNITTYSALLSFNSNDCDEGTITIPLNAEITCVAAGFSTFPSNIAANTDAGSCGAEVNYNVETVGNPTSTVSYTFTGATTGTGNGSGTNATFNVGTTTVTVNVSNPCGDETQSFDVTVTDNEAPVLTCPSDITTNNDTGICGAVINYSAPIGTDNCSGTSSGIHELHRGEAFYDYANNTMEGQGSPGLPMTFFPTEGQNMAVFLQNCGSSHYMYQNITVPSGGSPMLTYDMQYTNHYQQGFSNGQFVSIEIRNPSNNALIETLFKTLPGDPNSIPMTNFSFDISAYAGQSIQVRIVDATINNYYFDVFIDNVMVAGSDLTNGGFETGDYTGWTIFSHNGGCGTFGIGSGPGITTVQTAGLASGNVFPIGTTTNTFSITDLSGNTSTCSFDVTVEDNIAPVVIAQNITIQLDVNGAASIVPSDIDNGSNDACGIASTTLSQLDFDCSHVGENMVTLTVTDNNTNVSTVDAMVTVEDNISPTVITQNYVIDLANGVANIIPNDIDGGTFDNCDFTLAIDLDSFTCDDIGDHTVTLTATDASGNTSSNTAIVSIIGDVPTIGINDFYAVQTQKVNTIFLGFGPQSINLSTVVTGGSGFTYEWTTSTGELVSNEASPSISPTVSTTYNVTVTNSNGCTASTSLYVCVIDARSVDKKGRYKGKVTICHHTSGKKGTKHIVLNISSSAVMSHLTNHGEDTSHPDSLGECNATCVVDDQLKVSSTKSDASPEASNEFMIYPNPSKGVFNIKMSTIESETKISLFDVNGKLVDQKTLNKGNETNTSIGRNNLQSGIYILRITSKNETKVKKVIIN